MKFTMYVSKKDVEILRWLADWFMRSHLGVLNVLGRKIEEACDSIDTPGGTH